MLKNKKVLLFASIIILALVVVLGCFIFARINNASHQTQTLDALYMQTEKAVNSYVELNKISEDVSAYAKLYADNPNWENLNNLRVAVNYAKELLTQIPTEVLTLTDEQSDAARELDFDISALMTLCDAELKSDLQSAETALTSRQTALENFTLNSTYDQVTKAFSSDEEIAKWDKEYLLLELQYIWADFPEYGAREKLSESFPQYFDANYEWETDKEVVLEKANKHFSEYENIIAEANRTHGNAEGMFEAEKENGFTAAIIEGLPLMVADPLLADLPKTTYKDADNNKLDAKDIATAVEKVAKCTMEYENASYDEYINYLLKMENLKYQITDCVTDTTGNITEVVYSIGSNDYVVEYENDAIRLEIDNIDEMVLVPYWYIQTITPEALR